MRVLLAMSGGVDSSVSAALLLAAGHEVVGATMKLWGGSSDSGCCSVADVEDARRVAQQLGITHHVFNFTEDFDRHVVEPYVEAHEAGFTPNPCVECNRHLKFDRFFDRAMTLGFDAIATGHHARVTSYDGGWQLRRGLDNAKDQSYVLHMLDDKVLSKLLLPVGEMTKSQVRQIAADSMLRTAAKPDSQDVCFISRTGGRREFLEERIELRPGRLINGAGDSLGDIDAVQLVTLGQRRGLDVASAAGERWYAVDIDMKTSTVTLGTAEDLLMDRVEIDDVHWAEGSPPSAKELLEVQTSAHGKPLPCRWDGTVIVPEAPIRAVAPGQSVVLYRPDERGDMVVGSGRAIRSGSVGSVCADEHD